MTEFKHSSIAELETIYGDTKNNIRRFLQALEEKKAGTFTRHPERYGVLDLHWRRAEKILTAVIEISDPARLDYADVLQQLDELRCKHIELRCFTALPLQWLQHLMETVVGTQFRTIDLLIPYGSGYGTVTALKQFSRQFKKINHIVLYGTPRKIKHIQNCIFSTPQLLNNSKAFQHIGRDEYVMSVQFFCEAQQFNPYYNRKVCIDDRGEIKNCTSHTRSFGNAAERRIAEVADDPAFQELWHANNDRILEVMDSPFRYIWMNTHELEKIDDHYYSIKHA
ncbi:hypothetical protein [Chitinophaga vietnamensis]|uniref:hypothetical protein n=1 Tax=Chitinophaga vietnamensis TaxID=2593957 RepID=UPI0011786A6F|nr:hypothetical protein [Chitinophaga vietnamensis]